MKDKLSDRLEKFEKYEDFQRTSGQSITEYIAKFDSKEKKMKIKHKTPI